MSKTFKSALDSPVTLEVEDTFDLPGVPGVYLTIGQSVILLAPSDIPALMLALGECLPPLPDFVRDGSYEAYMAVVETYLDKAVRALESEAELEAEALELFNTLQVEIHGNLGPNWVHVTEFPNGETKRKWLAVARKAREMNKESTK